MQNLFPEEYAHEELKSGRTKQTDVKMLAESFWKTHALFFGVLVELYV